MPRVKSGAAGVTRRQGSGLQVPSGLTDPKSVIVVEVTQAFEPLVGLSGFFSPGSFNIGQKFYARPRRSLTVRKTHNTC